MKRTIILVVMATALLITTSILAQEDDQEQASVTAHWSPYKYPSTFPANAKIHIIIKGDSLWGIARKYYNNPLAWPQIHAANPYITDNHWIYPGDPVVLPDMTIAEPGTITDPGDADTAAGADVYQPADQDGTDSSRSGVRPPNGKDGELVNFGTDVIFETEPRQSFEYQMLARDMDLYCGPFITDSKLPPNIWIAGTEEDYQLEVQQYDIIYLNVGRDVVKPNEWYFCNTLDKKVLDPKTKEFLGYAYQSTGLIKVLLVSENHAVCEVLYACDGMHLGGILTPFEYFANPVVKIRHSMPIEEQYAEFDLSESGYLIYIPYDGLDITVPDVGVINLGIRDGIKPGDTLLCLDENVLHQVYPPLKWQKYIGRNIVARVIAEAHVIRVFEKTALISVTYAADTFQAGNLIIPASKSSYLESGR